MYAKFSIRCEMPENGHAYFLRSCYRKNSCKSVELPAFLGAQNVQKWGVIIEFKVFNSIFCHIVAN